MTVKCDLENIIISIPIDYLEELDNNEEDNIDINIVKEDSFNNGFQKGIKLATTDMVINMIKKNISVEDIKDITSLSEKDIFEIYAKTTN